MMMPNHGMQRAAATQYLEGLLNDSERKSRQAMPTRFADIEEARARAIHRDELEGLLAGLPGSGASHGSRIGS